MPRQSNRTARVEARISPDALAVVKRAAEIQGRSVSEFIVDAAQEAAHKSRIIAGSWSRSSIHRSRMKRSSARSRLAVNCSAKCELAFPSRGSFGNARSGRIPMRRRSARSLFP